MRRDFLRLFEIIQLPGSVTVLDIYIIVRVIVNVIQTGYRRALCALDIQKKSRVLLFKFQQQ